MVLACKGYFESSKFDGVILRREAANATGLHSRGYPGIVPKQSTFKGLLDTGCSPLLLNRIVTLYTNNRQIKQAEARDGGTAVT